jgi:hypothetical protein
MGVSLSSRESTGRGSAVRGPLWQQLADGTFAQLTNASGELVGSPTLPAGSIGADELASDAVTTAKILDGNVTLAKVETAIKTFTQQINLATITTTGNTDGYALIQRAGTLVGCSFSGQDALATSNSNYITFSLTNRGNVGGKSDAMLTTTDDVTTKTTGGSALAAETTRSLTVNSTPLNVTVAAGDRLRFRAAATGTLANTVTLGVVTLTFRAS